jgi:predicted choloylglycine hydrolase
LFARNLDCPTLGYLHEYSLVTVYRQPGKRTFASVGFPGLVGCLSGMNDAGLALAMAEVYQAADDSPGLSFSGVPYAALFRELLETCATVSEAEALLRRRPRAVMTNLMLCDTQDALLIESTPTSFVVRRPRDGLLAATNHFRAEALQTFTDCARYDALTVPVTADPTLGVSGLFARLHAASQGDRTLQSMVFDPTARVLHLAIGATPSSALTPVALSLEGCFGSAGPR